MTGRPCAIPLYANRDKPTASIGTGFLATLKGRLALFTAAHVPTQQQPTADQNWTGWPSQLWACVALNEHRPFDLFVETARIRTPLFRFRRADSGRLADMMAFTGPAHSSTLNALQANYEVLELVPEGAPSPTDPLLHCHGYPGVGSAGTWPYEPAAVLSLPFARVVDGPMIEAAGESENGYSGGPVLDSSGTFVGMLIGHGDGHTRVVPGAVLAHL